MFERYLADVLTTHFGHVVDNLDSEKTRLSAWNGELVLKDLSLRPDALDSFVSGCPVEIAYGKVGNLELRIPWNLLRSQFRWRKDFGPRIAQSGCSIILTDVNILITPRRQESGAASVHEEEDLLSSDEQRLQKERQVQSLLDAGLLHRVTESTVTSGRWTWVQDLLSNLLSTLSVTVRNIQIRYEDPGTSMGFVWSSKLPASFQRYRPAFAIGITLRQFSVQTDVDVDDDDDSNPTPQDAATRSDFQIRRKIAAADQLAIYWDSNCSLVSNTDDGHVEDDAMDSILHQSQHSYVLDPVSPTVKIALVPHSKDANVDSAITVESDDSSTDSTNQAPNAAITPPSSMILDLPPCNLTISRSTLEDIAYIRRSLSVWGHATKGILSERSLRRLAKLRPLEPPLKNPRAWWYYAFEASLALERVNKEGRDLDYLEFYRKRRRGWVGLVQALRRRKHYIELYKIFLTLSNMTEREECHEFLMNVEDKLLPEEIVKFRFALFDSLIQEDFECSTTNNSRWTSQRTRQDADNLIINLTSLSADQRFLMAEEMMQALHRERSNARHRDRVSAQWRSIELLDDQDTTSSECAVWKASVVCRQFSLQVNHVVPVIRLSFAWIQNQTWFEDGSWNLSMEAANFFVRDLTSSTETYASRKLFPNLIGPKLKVGGDFVIINGIRFEKSISISIQKKLSWKTLEGKMSGDFSDRGSTTNSQIRILPMELVYSTFPVEALSRVLATIKTPELVDDYHRMASAAHSWRERQKQKLLRALAHKNKLILIDVDIGAPELLIPEDINRRDTPMLAINLGRLQIFNDSSKNLSRDFDDQWRVVLSDIQVRSTTASRYSKRGKVDRLNLELFNSPSNATASSGQLVEPFSLDFTISTKIVSDEIQGSQSQTKVRVSATLPRLAFNLSSSALRLVSRLKMQWGQRKREMEARSDYLTQPLLREQNEQLLVDRQTISREVPPVDSPNEISRSSRLVHFQFSAPIVTLRLENDVDPMPIFGDVGFRERTPLVDLAFQGIHGDITQDVSVNGESFLKFGASLHSMGVVDLYQHAGKDFALLMSSIPQDLVTEKLLNENEWSWSDFHVDEISHVEEEFSRRNDLVAIEFKSQTSPEPQTSDFNRTAAPIDKLSIRFHELYVEWNPETLAAIQKAVRTPQGENAAHLSHHVQRETEIEDSDEEFFDAMDDEFFDAASEENSIHLLSGISSASLDEEPRQPHHKEDRRSEASFLSPNLGMGLQPGLVLSSTSQVSPSRFSQSATSPMAMSTHSSTAFAFVQSSEGREKPFELVFELSKLRVSFNKECRYRKVVIAEMDRTAVSYLMKPAAGSKTTMSIGNLVFIDPSTELNTTLYGQILGLKSNAEHSGLLDEPSSLLEMEISINPKTRRFSKIADPNDPVRNTQNVVIDQERGIVTGCNNFLHARFSPMRFVFLEQLWFEIIDYFFEGIIGTEVWGGTGSPTPPSQSEPTGEIQSQFNGTELFARTETINRYMHGSDAEGVSFTRFDITLDTPELLFPVTYRSPQFIRLQLASIKVRNHYDGAVVQDSCEETRMQWFNNCRIEMEELKIFSWCGRELGQKPEYAKVDLRWPTGPLATMIKPKWNVRCSIESLNVWLRRSDYSLLQNIISFNIGEPSRHLDEWDALQSLSSDKVDRYNQRLAVHFGYDKKDVVPTTYDLTVSIPSVSFSFAEHDKDSNIPLAVARCTEFVWQMKKGPDLILTQKATCDVDLVTPGSTAEFEKMLSLAKYDEDISSENDDHADTTGIPELTYTSTSRPSGDNVKTLEIVDACIYMVVPAWRRFTAFFQGLQPPTMYSENEIGASVQVGDRWYRVGDGEQVAEKKNVPKRIDRPMRWMRAISKTDISIKPKRASKTFLTRSSPTFQLKVSLTRPRIILSSASLDSYVQRLILRMQHLEFLHTNDGKAHSISRTFFFHDVEVYTSSKNKKLRRGTNHRENSLIHPWSVIGMINKCNGEKIGDCESHSIAISGDVLEARAAYSDMAIAVDVCLSVAYAARSPDVSTTNDQVPRLASSAPASASDSLDTHINETTPEANEVVDDFCKIPKRMLYCVELDGFELKVADDSGRHFAGDQDLVELSLGNLFFSREGTSFGASDMNLRLNSVDLFDCLQSKNSPFRIAASSRPGAMGLQRYRTQEFSGYTGSVPNKSLHRRMTWEEFGSEAAIEFGFSISPALLDRTGQASNHCFSRDSMNTVNQYPARELVECKCRFSGTGLREYDIKMRSFAVQWNPSTVIAIQRFLGRLRKESRIHKALYEFNQLANESAPASSGDDDSISQSKISTSGESICTRGNFEIDRLTVCLNKEHQRRRLIELTFSGSQVHLDSSGSGLSITGRLEDFSAWDSDSYDMRNPNEAPIMRENRNVIKVLGHESNEVPGPVTRTPFLEVQYTAFKMKDSSRRRDAVLPLWVDRHISESEDLDDFLKVKIAAFQFTYFRERTAEILDYLSNGLPGKGMGATSRAAKGFITKRILTKSFLELQISAPGVLIPQHESISDAIQLELGDVKIRSWFEPTGDVKKLNLTQTDATDWCRVLSLDLIGFRGGYARRAVSSDLPALSSATEPIDLKVVLRKPTVQGREVTISGALSFVELTLQYTDYLILRAVARDNLGRRIDKDRWDNVEKAYWLEEETGYNGLEGNDVDTIPDSSKLPRAEGNLVAYSSNARFIRYGKTRKNEQEIAPNDTMALSQSVSSDSDGGSTLDLRFELGGLSLTLRRDDAVDGVHERDAVAHAFHYDLMLLRVQLVEISLTANASGDMSFHLSLFRICLFDLGDKGRLMRENYYACLPSGQVPSCRKSKRKAPRQPCPFYVLAEGHATEEQSNSSEGDTPDGPQFVVTVDRCPASSAGAIGSSPQCELHDESKVIVARIVINNLTLNALIRPFKEIGEFLSCEWRSSYGQPCIKHPEYNVNDTASTKPEKTSQKELGQGFQVKLVAHYPRIFFLANECDLHTRALVLRGLAVVNMSNIKSFRPQNAKHFTAIDAQLVSMESYINPDVSEALRFRRRHQEMLGAVHIDALPVPDEGALGDAESSTTLGIALIQPVTTGLEFCEIKQERFATKRSVFINIEPVSTMLSFEDLQLIELVLKRFSNKESEKNETPDIVTDRTVNGGPIDTYDVTFHSERLGLGLRTEGTQVLVSSVQNPVMHHGDIGIGDCLLAIDNEDFSSRPLSEVVKCLAKQDRPTTIRFGRSVSGAGRSIISPSFELEKSVNESYVPSHSKESEKTGFVDSYSVKFRTGEVHGLELERSFCGRFPVVTRVYPTFFMEATAGSAIDETNSEQIEATFEDVDIQMPRPGSIIAGINDFAVDEIDPNEFWDFLLTLSTNGPDDDSDYASGSGSMSVGAFYTLHFKEIDSTVWGSADSVDVSLAGINVSFIDDLYGRDMPLFRGSFSQVQVHADRGLGILSQIMDVDPPSLLKLDDEPMLTGRTRRGLAFYEVEEIRSESVLSFSGIARCSIDYFHPRIAYWEPLLENSQLYLLCEKQAPSARSGRPGQLALEISDRLLHEQNFRGDGLPSHMSGPQMVSFNLTDASVDVFTRAIKQWKEWRENVLVDSNDVDFDEESLVQATENADDFSVTAIGLKGSSSDGIDDTQGLGLPSSFEEGIERQGTAKQVAAQKAAQAALVFAQKRGAETSRKGESAKPFILRNRTGVSIAFVQGRQAAGEHTSSRRDRPDRATRQNSLVGEYTGLRGYRANDLTELADQEDAKFSMELLPDQGTAVKEADIQGTSRVRNYEGRYPSLTIAIQAVAGVSVAPLEDLQVFKVGSAIRYLTVRKDADTYSSRSEHAQYSIPVVWKVEIDDNRRVLTLSTAVRVVSTGFNTSVEVGVRSRRNSSIDTSSGGDLSIFSIGISRPGNPFYLPLWLSLRLQSTDVHVRPLAEGENSLRWGNSSVLHFGPTCEGNSNESVTAEIENADTVKWTWEESFPELGYIRCDQIADSSEPVWLAVFVPSVKKSASSRRHYREEQRKDNVVTTDFDEVFNEVLSVTVDSCVTIRNMLPMSVEWEVAHWNEEDFTPVDGSSFREHTMSSRSSPKFFSDVKSQSYSPGILRSGDCTEVFACNDESQCLQARFKEPFGDSWSNWVSLTSDEIEYYPEGKGTDGQDVAVGILPAARQVNVQVTNDAFGVPLTLGVRILPKTTVPSIDDPSRGRTYGLEVILYAELWIRNITDLPLNFGCPSHQFHEPGHAGGDGELAARFTAESALMEIANLLEVGDKGTGLRNQAAIEVAESGKIKSLPNQECDTLVEEVFEYVEIESSTVKRRWWASESYDSYREKIVDVVEPLGRNPPWRWQDETWSVDCSGQAEVSFGGWESCRNLLAGAGSFSGHRTFSPQHAIRRRRFFRSRSGHFSSFRTINSNFFSDVDEEQSVPGSLLGGLQAFHQPLTDSFTKEKRKAMKKKKVKKQNQDRDGDQGEDDFPLKIAVKCGDGKWSVPTTIPSLGTSHGVMRVLASRWLTLTRNNVDDRNDNGEFMYLSEGTTASIGSNLTFPVTFRPACLNPQLFELCYTVSAVDGEWGEFSRVMTVSPRFLVRNDSKEFSIEVKQAGVPDAALLKLTPGEVQPFYWADFRLPGLASVSPSIYDKSGQRVYQWSGGFDLCNLGMVPLRLRTTSPVSVGHALVKSIRATIEVRPGTGGTGINISFKDEDPDGEGSLFRIENSSTFPVWIAQDGVLANPYAMSRPPSETSMNNKSIGNGNETSMLGDMSSRSDGDLFLPNAKSTYALDVPYRQGKYAHRKEASMNELLRVRVALSPLSSRDGIETVKVIGLTKVGDSIRLNPSRLVHPISPDTRDRLQRIRVLAIIKTDGPTRVLSFCLIETPAPDVFGNPFGDVAYMTGSKIAPESQGDPTKLDGYVQEVRNAANITLKKVQTETIQTEDEAKRSALIIVPENITKRVKHEQDQNVSENQIYSFRAEFSGFLFSLIDSTPSEIAVVSLKNFNVLARWDSFRRSDASLIFSIGWLQVDNHVPSAPFKVAVRPDAQRQLSASHDDGDDASASNAEDSPLLVIGLSFAPKHKSGIMCLRSVTVAPRDLVIALDLAFLVRLQRFFLGIRSYFSNTKVTSDLLGDRSGMSALYTDQKRCIAFPKFEGKATEMERAAVFSSENQKVYFHGLTILPCNITLSVAPARALTSSQASLEGKEAAAIHQAVRKGDVLVGNSSVLLGVRVGRRNATPLAVASGVLKSIVVDALLRLDGASLNFSGVSLRHHVSTGPQLTTYLLAHYLSSLRQNVPALIGSLAAFGNPLGLIRGLGDGVSDFVNEPMKGLKKSVKELDPSFLVDGVARGTESLARHTVGGFADSASLLTETFSKNMAVLTLDRRYAQKRDRKRTLRLSSAVDVTLAGGVESGFIKLVQGFVDGVTGVVKAPIRGAEKRGIEGFAKGVGKGLLGLLVKPMIGISDAATDVMIGVKRTVEDNNAQQQNLALASNQFRPRRPMYGRDKVLRPYEFDDAAAATLMLRTRCASENYLSHLDLGDRVALLSVSRIVLIGANGQEMFALKYKHVSSMEVRPIPLADGSDGWGIIILLSTPRRNGSDIEVISCTTKEEAMKLFSQIKRGTNIAESIISP